MKSGKISISSRDGKMKGVKMISKSFKVLDIIDGYEYVFSAFAFKANVRKYKADQKAIGESLTNEMVLEQIAECAHVSVDAIKNWMYAKNGPGDLETVKAIAEFLKVNYIDLLKQQEKKTMSENKIVTQDMAVDMEKTKDVIRVVYQKMSAFMDAAVEELCFELSEESFWEYDAEYKDLVRTLHQSMLDIPITIYDQLRELVEDELALYIYGEDCMIRIWDTEEYKEFDAKYNGIITSQLWFMEKKSEEFYSKIREILKDYLLI